MAISFNPANVSYLRDTTVSISGLSASTAYMVTITNADGGVRLQPVKSDGSGNASFHYSAHTPGKHTFDVRPATEHSGTTTAAASGSITVGSG